MYHTSQDDVRSGSRLASGVVIGGPEEEEEGGMQKSGRGKECGGGEFRMRFYCSQAAEGGRRQLPQARP